VASQPTQARCTSQASDDLGCSPFSQRRGALLAGVAISDAPEACHHSPRSALHLSGRAMLHLQHSAGQRFAGFRGWLGCGLLCWRCSLARSAQAPARPAEARPRAAISLQHGGRRCAAGSRAQMLATAGSSRDHTTLAHPEAAALAGGWAFGTVCVRPAFHCNAQGRKRSSDLWARKTTVRAVIVNASMAWISSNSRAEAGRARKAKRMRVEAAAAGERPAAGRDCNIAA
jgi:hypothetical protein